MIKIKEYDQQTKRNGKGKENIEGNEGKII